MARKRLESPRLTDWGEVDETLYAIGAIDRDLAAIESRANEEIDRIKADAKEEAEPLRERKSSFERDLKEFCEANRGEFAQRKSRILTFGSVGFRFSTRVLIKRVADTLRAIKELGLQQCIRVKEEPDKEALKRLPMETLAALGVGRKEEDVFGYEIDRQRVEERGA